MIDYSEGNYTITITAMVFSSTTDRLNTTINALTTYIVSIDDQVTKNLIQISTFFRKVSKKDITTCMSINKNIS